MMKVVYSMMFAVFLLTTNMIAGLGSWWLLGGLIFYVLTLILFIPIYDELNFESMSFTFDISSISLMLLSLFLMALMIMASIQVLNLSGFSQMYLCSMLFLLMMLMFSFVSGSYFMFYFFFEASLIPTFYIIVGWGYQPERLQSGIYFMVYTLVMSLPLLFVIFMLDKKLLSLMMWDSLYFMTNSFLKLNYVNIIFMLLLVMAFLVKLPMFLVHLWLPKAHVEAPVSGSMVLAGVLLKLGGYGLIRVYYKFTFIYISMSFLFSSLSLLGMFYIGLICCRLNDLKALVAYSSVAHMGLVIGGIFSGLVWGVNGGLLMMVSHGLSSSGLFCFVNMMYERVSSRSIYLNKGIICLIPLFSLMLFLLCCANISAPPSINLISEIFILISLNKLEILSVVLFFGGSFMGAVFTLYLFSLVNHGKIFNNTLHLLPPMHSELHALVVHLIPINMLVLKSEMFFSL